jgi:hypothetical protein
MASIDNLPLPMYELIRDYIIDYKIRDTSLLKQINNWKQFLSLQKSSRFHEIRSVSNYFSLSSSFTSQYLLLISGKDIYPDSRLESIVEAVTNPSKQLQLNLIDNSWWSDSQLCQLTSLNQCHSLVCYDIRFESNIHVSDVFDFDSIEYLNFRGCANINLSRAFSSSSSSSSRRIKYLALSDTEDTVQDTNIHYLKDIAMLNLSDCQYLSNISSLINVFDLNLQGNSRIKDVSCLKNSRIYRLNISHCNGIEDISALSDIPVLNVAMSNHIRIGLRNDNTVKELSISPKMVAALQKYLNKEKKRVVCIEGHVRVNSLQSCLIGFRKVEISYNEQLYGFNQDIPSLSHLSIRFCFYLCFITSLTNLQYLKLEGNTEHGLNIDFLSLSSLVTLEASSCKFNSLDLNGNIKNVILNNQCSIANNKITVFHHLRKLVVNDFMVLTIQEENKLLIDKVGQIDELVCNTEYALFNVELL